MKSPSHKPRAALTLGSVFGRNSAVLQPFGCQPSLARWEHRTKMSQRSFLSRIGLRRQCVARLKLGAWCAVAALLWSIAGRADTIVLNPVRDTYLNNVVPDGNFGGESGIKLGTSGSNGGPATQRGLLMFDPAAMPAGSAIQSVQLLVTVTSAPLSETVPNFGLFPVLVDWKEAEATWNNRLQSQTWGEAGGLAGSDYSGTASASIPLMSLGDYTFPSSAALVADVQSWLDDPSTNHGWIIISDHEGTQFTARRIGSRESSTPPKLQIDFLAPPKIETITFAGDSVQIQFAADAPYAYEVQYTPTLTPPAWQTLTNVTAKFASFDASVSDSVTNGSQRVYRVMRSGPIR